MHTVIGTILVLLAIAGVVFVKRREFYRRNQAGIEEFNGYGNMLATRAIETGIKVVSLLFFVIGVVQFVAY